MKSLLSFETSIFAKDAPHYRNLTRPIITTFQTLTPTRFVYTQPVNTEVHAGMFNRELTHYAASNSRPDHVA
jgi:hypothetical protein